MYWAEFGKLRDVLRAKGKTYTQIEDYRHGLTLRALGVQKSSTKFTNTDLDKVLARIRAEREPANLDAQIQLQESPEKLRGFLLERCDDTCSRMWSEGCDTRLMRSEARAGYIAGTARNVIKKEVSECSNEDLGKVLGCLEARLQRLLREVRARQVAAGAKIEADDVPF